MVKCLYCNKEIALGHWGCYSCVKNLTNKIQWCTIHKNTFSSPECPLCDPIPLKKEDIKQQSHYTQHKIQPVIFIGENKMDFLAGNVIKYVSRYNLNNGVEDLEKARHYLDMLIQRERGEAIKP